jgi:hypothetical protein
LLAPADIVGIGAFVLGIGVGAAIDARTAAPTVSDEPGQPATTESAPAAEPVDEPVLDEPSEPAYSPPVAKDITLSIKVLEKECFGDAGSTSHSPWNWGMTDRPWTHRRRMR